MHYKDPVLAKEKWERRIERINQKNIIFKFSYMNNCTQELLNRFFDMELYGKKIAFVKTEEDAKKDHCAVYYPGFETESQILNDTFYWNKYIDVTAFVNENKMKR